MGKGNFGYFGTGTNGYIHYMQFMESTKKGGGAGRKPSRNSGCLTVIISALEVIMLLIWAF